VRLIAIDTGRATLLFPLEEIVPLDHPLDGRQLTAGIVERYNFKLFPPENLPREELNKNGAKFENGRFEFEGQLVEISDFTVFNDGIVANAKSTEAAYAFVDDLLDYVRSKFGFRKFTSKVREIIASQVVVEFDVKLAALIPTFERITALIASETGQIYGSSMPLDFFRLDFQLDKEKAKLDYAQPRFTIERRAGTPYSQERYFCSALMHTKSHLSILKQIEKMLVA
jgi:hypothetical protein